MTGNRLSAMEHLVPEQMFSTPEAPAQGISAVKAIELACAAGQKSSRFLFKENGFFSKGT